MKQSPNHFAPLHPASLPKKERAPCQEFTTFAEFLETLISREGWSRVLKVQQVPGSGICKILDIRTTDDLAQAPLVFMESEENFKNGTITHAWVKYDCLECYVKTRQPSVVDRTQNLRL